ncbi:hypothetical protein MPTK2_4g16980 [Marchantia polymorpha subsp. ruderalis]
MLDGRAHDFSPGCHTRQRRGPLAPPLQLPERKCEHPHSRWQRNDASALRHQSGIHGDIRRPDVPPRSGRERRPEIESRSRTAAMDGTDIVHLVDPEEIRTVPILRGELRVRHPSPPRNSLLQLLHSAKNGHEVLQPSPIPAQHLQQVWRPPAGYGLAPILVQLAIREQLDPPALVLDMLERHPGNELLMNEVNSMKTGALNFVNTVLVAAALLGGVTFSALLQPPFGAAFGYNAFWTSIFWTYNCMSFYFSMYTILCCLGTSISTQQHMQRITGLFINTTSRSLRVFYDHEQAQLVIPLVFCVVSGMVAFIGAGFANLPPDARVAMLVCTIVGAVFVLIQAAHRIIFTFKNALLYLDLEPTVETWFLNSLMIVMKAWLGALNIQFNSRKLLVMSSSNPLDRNEVFTRGKLLILPLHFLAIFGITYYIWTPLSTWQFAAAAP